MQPKLDHITIKGFRSLAHVEKLRLNDVNVLIGANGSGKSNFVEAFSFLRALRQRSLQRYVAQAGGANQLLHFGAARTPEMSFKVSMNDEVDQYEVALVATDRDGLRPISEVAYHWTDCVRFANAIGQSEVAGALQAVRAQFATPEEIDDSPETAPSKRIQGLVPGYGKVFMGILGILEIGLAKIRGECRHFDEWLVRLEQTARVAREPPV